MLAQLRRAVRLTADPDLIALEREVLAYPNIKQIAPMIAAQATEDPALLVPFRVSTALGEVAMFTTLTTFGTPRDVTLEELVVELFFPADESSAAKLRDLAAQRPRA